MREQREQEQEHEGSTEKAFASLTNQPQEPGLKGESTMTMQTQDAAAGSAARDASVSPARIEVKAGTVLTIDVLRWDEGWDFDCPVCVLRPALAFSPNGDHADQMAESFAEDAAFRGYVESEWTEDGMLDRQYPVKSLKRRWAAARRGVVFPVRGYTAYRFTARFYTDRDGLTFKLTEVKP